MRTLILALFVGSLLLVGCGQDSGKAVPSTPVPTGASNAPGAPKKGAIQGAQATFNGPGAKDADTRAGTKMTGH